MLLVIQGFFCPGGVRVVKCRFPTRRANVLTDEVTMAARSIRTFTVLPHLPERLQPLQKLAYNMWWCWNHEAVSLFRRIDDDLFDTLENSPVKLLGAIDQVRLDQLLHDDGF